MFDPISSLFIFQLPLRCIMMYKAHLAWAAEISHPLTPQKNAKNT